MGAESPPPLHLSPKFTTMAGDGQISKLASILSMPWSLGRVFFVRPAADTGYAEWYRRVRMTYPGGVPNIYNTVAAAYAAMTSNNNDVCVLGGHGAHAVTAMLDVSKSRCHFIGWDAGLPLGLSGGREYGQASKIEMGVTTAATDIAAVQNTGVRNTFRNIKISSANTVDEGLYAFAEGGEYTLIENCEIYKSTDLNETGAAELLFNGDSSVVRNCTIGSTVNAISGAILRPCVLMSRETITGKVARDFTFEKCTFLRKCGDTGNRFVYGANATDVERKGLFDRCLFWNAKLAAATPAQNVAFGASQTEGEVLLWGCMSQNAGTAMSTTTGVFVGGFDQGADSTAEGAAQIGISIQAT